MAKLFIEESTLTSIADAIRSKEGSTELIPPLEMPARIEALSGGGLALEENARIIQLASLNSLGKSDATLNLYKAKSLQRLVDVGTSTADDVNTTVVHLTINCPNKVNSISNCLNGYLDKTLKRITFNVDTSDATNVSYAFSSNYVLEIIDGTPLDFSSVTSGGNMSSPFHLCHELREIRVKGTINVSIPFMYSKKLSKASIDNIMSCLSSNATGQTLTLSLEAVNNAYETSEGAADGSTSAEWLALVAAHSNWTISLV